MAGLLHFDVAPFNLVVRAVVVFLGVLILLRISGKRQIGQMGATEFVALLLASVLILLSIGISILTYRSSMFEMLLEGTPRVIVHNGGVVEKNLKKERLSHTELRTFLRKQGVHHFKEVKSAVLEADGFLSIVRYSVMQNEAVVIHD